jgi:hypothetical protein
MFKEPEEKLLVVVVFLMAIAIGWFAHEVWDSNAECVTDTECYELTGEAPF